MSEETLTQSDRERGWRMAEVVFAIIVAISLALSGWCFSTVIQLQSDMAAIKASRFNATDGLEVWKAIGELKQQMAIVPKEVPPKWFLDQFAELKAEVIANRQRQSDMERKLDAILDNQKAGAK